MALQACTAPRPARPAEVAHRPAPAPRAELVFLARPYAEASRRPRPEPERFRRDRALADRPSVALTAADLWPTPPKLDGERTYRFRATTSPRSLTFFRGPSDRAHGRGGRDHFEHSYRPR